MDPLGHLERFTLLRSTPLQVVLSPAFSIQDLSAGLFFLSGSAYGA